MHSKAELMGMILTEALEMGEASGMSRPARKGDKEKDTVKYNLRLVRLEDGRLEWRD